MLLNGNRSLGKVYIGVMWDHIRGSVKIWHLVVSSKHWHGTPIIRWLQPRRVHVLSVKLDVKLWSDFHLLRICLSTFSSFPHWTFNGAPILHFVWSHGPVSEMRIRTRESQWPQLISEPEPRNSRAEPGSGVITVSWANYNNYKYQIKLTVEDWKYFNVLSI